MKTKTEQIHIRVTKEELKEIKKNAKLLFFSDLSKFIRTIALNIFPENKAKKY